MTVCVQQEESLVEGLDLDDAHARVLLDAFWFGFPGVDRLQGPGLSVRVHDEGLDAGGDGGDGLRLPGQAERGPLSGFRILAGLVAVDSALPVHGQQQVSVHADAGEPDILSGVEERRRGLLVVPGVYVLVGSECCLQVAAGCGLLVVEPFVSLGGERNLFGCVVLRPGVDAAVACQADNLLSCGMDVDIVRLLRAGRLDG